MISEVVSVDPRLRVIVPGGVVHFGEAIPIGIALEPGADRSETDTVVVVVQTGRDRLEVRVDPTVITGDDFPRPVREEADRA